ncbi:MAG: ATP-binding protein [bacterium]|nr:ATP-binding protein [bacterium]
MRKSIIFKIFTGYFFIIFGLTGLIAILSFNTTKHHYIETIAGDLKNLCFSLESQVLPYLEETRYQELDNFVKDLGKKINVRITVVSPQGIVLADSEKDPKLMENHKTRPEIKEVLEGKFGKSIRLSTTVREKMIYIALPIEKDGKLIGILRTSLFLKDINNLIYHLKIKILPIIIIIFLFSLLIAFLVSQNITNNIRELSAAARVIAQGNFDIKVPLKSSDELRELANSFNYMSSQIKTLFSELSHQKEALSGIISTIQEGLLVLDKNDKIVLSNNSFNRIIDNASKEETIYLNFLRTPAFNELIKDVRKTKSNFTKEIEINDKVFLSSATFVSSKEEIIVIFHDITQIKALEKIKKDFVVNVSHELRTPLTAIKGFAETLDEEIDKKNKPYLEIIRNHTDRLINIVNDLLALSELQEKGFNLKLEDVDLKNLVENTLKIFEEKLKNKEINVKLDVKEPFPNIKADSFKLEQMLINLIDNAIKYTDKGEIKISLKAIDKMIKIEIEDTGIGIPGKDLSRIFERFYVVDKSRSRKSGGTGLGLSIVKHIILAHNGQIDVESKVGSGTKFSIVLPLSSS